jgi:adenylate cyclase
MLRSYFRLLPRDTIADARQKVQQQLRTLDPALLREDWILFSVLGLRQDTDPPMPTEPLMARSRLRAVLADIVKAAGREPGVIIFDDLHWLDPVSGGLLEAMIEATAGTHILVVLNFRPSFRAGWMQTQRYRHLELNEMGFSGSDTLVTDLIGNAAELRPVRSQVAARCAGNPFFAEELVRSLVETGILAGSPGAYRIGTATSEISLPPTVEAVIGARLDRLSEPAKTLLQLCATIGKEFPISLLREITGQSSHEIEQTLSQLQAADIVQERPGPLGRSFGFRHPMFQEVAYATQLRTRRRELHADVARAIETFPWGKMDEFAGLLAHHCEAAGEAMAAARHLQRSAHWIGRTDSSQALQQWKKVCALLVDAPSSATNRRLLAQASSQVLNYGWREGITVTEAKPYADQAVSYARETNDTVHGPLLLATYGRILAATGAADEYVTLSREALSMRANDIDVTRDAMLHGTHAQALWLSGRPRDALRMVEAGLALFASSTPRTEREESEFEAFRRSGFDPKHWLHAQKARFYVWLGRFKEAEAAIALMELMETTFGEVAVVKFIPHLAAAELGFWQQSAPLAQRHATLLTDYAERLRLPYLRVAALFADGLAASAAADFDTAIVSMQKALSFARHSNAGLEFEPLLLSAIAGATLQAGAALKAATLAADAMKIGQQRTNRIAECQASLVWASALLHDGSQNAIARARPLLARAEELIDASGAVVFEPMAIHVRTRLEALY